MVKVALIYHKDEYITREYTDEEDLHKNLRDSRYEYGEFSFLEDAIDNLAQTYPNGEEFIIKLVGFKGLSK
jgi:hypothetical protein